jgi:hypothetical protein
MTTEKQPIPYKVRDVVTGDVIYANGKGASQVRTFASHNRFEVTRLTVGEILKSNITAAQILDATGELHPDQAPLDLRPKADAPAAP